jgi:hypothetical protein
VATTFPTFTENTAKKLPGWLKGIGCAEPAGAEPHAGMPALEARTIS